jgi:transcriptional regulator with XRE-family HTH domain
MDGLMTDTDAVARAIASNLRRLRAARNWSLDTLAARSGVSRGMLIQIEQARTNPSVGTLVRVADSLGVSVAQLLDVSDASRVRIVRAADAVPLWRSGGTGGTGVGTLLVGTEAPPVVELWDWRLAPGDRHDAEAHAAGTTELLYVLDGELSLTVAGAAHTLAAGDSVVFRGDREHSYANAGSAALRFVMAVSVHLPGDQP